VEVVGNMGSQPVVIYPLFPLSFFLSKVFFLKVKRIYKKDIWKNKNKNVNVKIKFQLWKPIFGVIG